MTTTTTTTSTTSPSPPLPLPTVADLEPRTLAALIAHATAHAAHVEVQRAATSALVALVPLQGPPVEVRKARGEALGLCLSWLLDTCRTHGGDHTTASGCCFLLRRLCWATDAKQPLLPAVPLLLDAIHVWRKDRAIVEDATVALSNVVVLEACHVRAQPTTVKVGATPNALIGASHVHTRTSLGLVDVDVVGDVVHTSPLPPPPTLYAVHRRGL